MKKYLFFTAIFLIIYFIVAAYNNADWDLWHRLAAGKLFFSTGHVPKTDIFSYTPVKDLWIDHEWGSGAVFYFFVEKFGSAGLSWLKFALMFLTFLPVYLLNRSGTEGEPKYRLIFYGLFLYSLIFGFLNTIRSQCFTFAFFAIWLYALERVRRGNNKLLWIFPPMTILWANLHGGFLAGLGILVLYGIGEFFNKKNPAKYFVVAAISGLLTVINPYGYKYWEFLAESVTLSRPFITEWQSLDLFGPFIIALGFKLFLLMTIIALPYVFIKRSREVRWAEILILIVTCYLSLKHIRHNVFFVIAAAAYMGEYFFSAVKYYMSFIPEKFKNFMSKKLISGFELFKDTAIYAMILVIGILTVHFVPFNVEVSNERFPVKSVEFIKKNNLSGNLLVLFNWGSYALWNLYPQCQIAMDGRYEEVYPTWLVNESARFHYVEKDWEDFMKKYKTDLILLDKEYPVYSELLSDKDWKIIYEDRISAVFLPMEKNRKIWLKPDDDITVEEVIFDSDIAEEHID